MCFVGDEFGVDPEPCGGPLALRVGPPASCKVVWVCAGVMAYDGPPTRAARPLFAWRRVAAKGAIVRVV